MKVLGLGRRLIGRRDMVQAVAIVAAPMAVLLALFMTIHALTLSPTQQSDMLFGRYAGAVQLSGTTHTLTGAPPRSVINEVRGEAPEGQSAVVLNSPDLRFDELGRFNNALYLEADWPERPYGERFSLLRGQLPRQPGEIAVADGLFNRPLGRVLSADSGNIKLRVVGVIRDRFARSSAQVLGAAGTWAAFDWHRLNRAGFSMGANVEVLGNFPNWDKVEGIVRRYQERISPGSSNPTIFANRSTVAANPPQSFVEQEPLAYRAPATALAVLCPLLLLGLRGRRARRWTAILRAIGVRPGRSAAAVAAGSIVLALGAIPVGAVTGELLGLLVRLVPLSNGPLSPPVSVFVETARFAVVAAVALLAAGLLTAVRQRGHNVRELLARRPSARLILGARFTGALIAVVGIVYMVPEVHPGTNNIAISILATLAVCLLVPDVLTALRRASTGHGVRWRLVSSRLLIDRGKSAAVCAALIACIGPFVAISGERAAGQALERATRVLQIPEGQVAVGRPPRAGFDRVDPRALEITKRVTSQRPIEVTQITQGRNYYASPAVAVVAPRGRAPGLQPALLGVPSVAALRHLLGDSLTARASAVVADGGVLHFDNFGSVPVRAPLGMFHYQREGTRLRNTTPEVPIASIPNDHAWSSQGSGFLLNSTARQLGLPTHVHLSVFSHITPAKTKQITGALRRAGLPVNVLIQTQPFQLAPEPAGLFFWRYGMLALLAVLMTVALTSSARSLRKESRSLVAIGLRRSWAQRALALQSAILTVIGVLGGIIVGAVSVGIYAARQPQPMFAVVVPVGQLAILVGGSIVIAVLTALLASRGLTPRKASS